MIKIQHDFMLCMQENAAFFDLKVAKNKIKFQCWLHSIAFMEVVC